MINLIIGTLFGGIISWVITHYYHKKAFKEQSQQINKLTEELNKYNLTHFEKLLLNSKWNKEIIGNKEIWVSEKDNTFQIHIGESTGSFSENWTIEYPDPNAKKYPVYLKINNSIITEILFISIDGGRIFVPITERKMENSSIVEYWNVDSLRIKVCRIIGQYYIYNNIEGVAKTSKIELV